MPMKKTVSTLPLWNDLGFTMECLEYHAYPAMRFVGVADGDQLPWKDANAVLDGMTAYQSDFPHPVFLFHHNGLDADKQRYIGISGRFMKAESPVPQGFVSVDFVPENDGTAGAPYLSRFALAVFSGDMKAMHRDDMGYAHATFETLGKDGADMLYPHKFWHGEVFFDGPEAWSTGYLCSMKSI